MEKSEIISISKKEVTKMDILNQWLKELVFPGDIKNFIEEDCGQSRPEEGLISRSFSFYTENHRYFISAIEQKNGEGYLGCSVSARKPRAGEEWLRGNDLPDGPFNKSTWDKILNAIVSYELVRLSEYKRPDTVPK